MNKSKIRLETRYAPNLISATTNKRTSDKISIFVEIGFHISFEFLVSVQLLIHKVIMISLNPNYIFIRGIYVINFPVVLKISHII